MERYTPSEAYKEVIEKFGKEKFGKGNEPDRPNYAYEYEDYELLRERQREKAKQESGQQE